MRLRIFLSILFFCCYSFAAIAQIRQNQLYIDDGTGRFTILQSSALGAGGQTLSFPNAGGTSALAVLQGTPFNGTNAWQAGDLLYASATGNTIDRLASVNNSGTNYFLQNDGSGNLSWKSQTVLQATSSTTDLASVANVYINLSGMSETLSLAGNYLVLFNADVEQAAANSISVAIYQNGVQIANSVRTTYGIGAASRINISTMYYLSASAGDVLVIRFASSNTTGKVDEKTLIVQKVN